MSVARVLWASGPVLKARPEGPFQMREAVAIGRRSLLGEVVAVSGAEITAQVYEDPTGLKPGEEVRGSGAPLGIRLGPGLLGNIFDGLLRPLSGARAARFDFAPGAKKGDALSGGAVFGRAGAQDCLVPPHLGGEVIEIAAPGPYAEDATLCRLRAQDGAVHEVSMGHFWPVRAPRPVAERLPSDEPLVTGQRILDGLFPVVLGGKAAIPGGFGTGKTVLLESLAKSCNADVIVYLGCGERGNEMAGVLSEFPGLRDPRTGRPLMERTVIIANTSNMPVAAREASIYSAVTVAEYFRDQGLHVALMADSTSRWAEALREVSGRLGELPGEGGYPAYLSSRLADFYERAAKVRTLSGRTGSVTLLSSISPPSGDFSEPVTSHSKRFVRSFWALDQKRAQARFYPAVHPLQSYSEDASELVEWWDRVFGALPARGAAPPVHEWSELRRKFLTLLDEQVRLERMARIVGKDALPARQQLTLFCAEIVNEAFLRQSAFSDVDWYASPQRLAAMMRLIGRFIALAERSLAQGMPLERITSLGVLRALQRMGEEIAEGDPGGFAALARRVEDEFRAAGETVRGS
ncbi:MAG TPA: V-type ATP synthase subunit A [Burkholderiales bacterium]|nr:V-type ATP synthase subunit A [Burkholderiales bacterium]